MKVDRALRPPSILTRVCNFETFVCPKWELHAYMHNMYMHMCATCQQHVHVHGHVHVMCMYNMYMYS